MKKWVIIVDIVLIFLLVVMFVIEKNHPEGGNDLLHRIQ